MDEVRIIEVKESVFADNDRQAEALRRELKEKGVFLLNLMSSPVPARPPRCGAPWWR